MAAALLAAWGGLPLAAQEASETAPGEAARGLLGSYEGAWSELPPLQDALVELGPPVIPTLFRTLSEARLVPTDRPLTAPHRLAIDGALERLPRGAVIGHLRTLLPGEPAERIEMASLLGRLGSAGDLDLVLELGRLSHVDGDVALQRSVESALGRMIQRESVAVDRLVQRLPRLDGGTGATAVRSLGGLGTHAALGALATALPRTPRLAAPILLEVDHLARVLPTPADPSVGEAVQGCLGLRDPAVRAVACRALGALDDRSAVEGVLSLLDDDHGAVRAAAHAALEELSGHRLVADREAWSSWIRVQRDWMETQAKAHLEVVVAGKAEVASAALRKLATHRVFSEQLVPELLPVLAGNDPRMAARVCGVLGHLGSWEAVWPLVAKLDTEHAGLRDAALAALRRITALELSADPKAWEQHLHYLTFD